VGVSGLWRFHSCCSYRLLSVSLLLLVLVLLHCIALSAVSLISTGYVDHSFAGVDGCGYIFVTYCCGTRCDDGAGAGVLVDIVSFARTNEFPRDENDRNCPPAAKLLFGSDSRTMPRTDILKQLGFGR